MLPQLTVQQRAQRCTCNRYLAWWTTVHAVCCRCMDPPETCRCEPTSDPAEGCFALALDVPEVEREGDECD
jgi:hypothetical protein